MAAATGLVNPLHIVGRKWPSWQTERTVRVEQIDNAMPNLQQELRVSPFVLMHMMGYLKACPRTPAYDPGRWMMGTEWGNYIDDTSNEHRYGEPLPREHSHISELAGMGFAGVFMWHGRKARYLTRARVQPHGKRPDCVCKLPLGAEYVRTMFEAKGTAQHYTAQEDFLLAGLYQVGKLMENTPRELRQQTTERWVISTFIPKYGVATSPRLLLIDPPPPFEVPEYSDLQLACLSFGSAAYWAGLRRTGAALVGMAGWQAGRETTPAVSATDLAEKVTSLRATFDEEADRSEHREFSAKQGDATYIIGKSRARKRFAQTIGVARQPLQALISEADMTGLERVEKAHQEEPTLEAGDHVVTRGPGGSLLQWDRLLNDV